MLMQMGSPFNLLKYMFVDSFQIPYPMPRDNLEPEGPRGAHFQDLDRSWVGLKRSGLFWDRSQNGPVFFKPVSSGLFLIRSFFGTVLFWLGVFPSGPFLNRSRPVFFGSVITVFLFDFSVQIWVFTVRFNYIYFDFFGLVL